MSDYESLLARERRHGYLARYAGLFNGVVAVGTLADGNPLGVVSVLGCIICFALATFSADRQRRYLRRLGR